MTVITNKIYFVNNQPLNNMNDNQNQNNRRKRKLSE